MKSTIRILCLLVLFMTSWAQASSYPVFEPNLGRVRKCVAQLRAAMTSSTLFEITPKDFLSKRFQVDVQTRNGKTEIMVPSRRGDYAATADLFMIVAMKPDGSIYGIPTMGAEVALHGDLLTEPLSALVTIEFERGVIRKILPSHLDQYVAAESLEGFQTMLRSLFSELRRRGLTENDIATPARAQVSSSSASEVVKIDLELGYPGVDGKSLAEAFGYRSIRGRDPLVADAYNRIRSHYSARFAVDQSTIDFAYEPPGTAIMWVSDGNFVPVLDLFRTTQP